MRQPDVSVIICTHNPRTNYFERVLAGLRAQTLPSERWELIVVDNASKELVANRFDAGWYPNARHIREDALGVAQARLRGIAESVADLIVFVDDDNLLEPDYLERGLQIAGEYLFLGTWGGQSLPEFEVEPASGLKPFLYNLALRTTDRDSWTNLRTWSDGYPFGAGLCVRRNVAAKFKQQTMACGLRQMFGRRGRIMLANEDYEINLTACDMGLGCGVFQALKLTHLIPARRVTVEFMLQLHYGLGFSDAMLLTSRGTPPADPLPTRFRRLFERARLRRQPYPQREIIWARMIGMHDGLRFSREFRTDANSPIALADSFELLFNGFYRMT